MRWLITWDSRMLGLQPTCWNIVMDFIYIYFCKNIPICIFVSKRQNKDHHVIWNLRGKVLFSMITDTHWVWWVIILCMYRALLFFSFSFHYFLYDYSLHCKWVLRSLTLLEYTLDGAHNKTEMYKNNTRWFCMGLCCYLFFSLLWVCFSNQHLFFTFCSQNFQTKLK